MGMKKKKRTLIRARNIISTSHFLFLLFWIQCDTERKEKNCQALESYLIDICWYLTAWPWIRQPCWVSVFSHRKSRRQTTWFQRCPGAQKFPQWRYKCQERSLSVVQVHLRPAHCPLAKGQWFPNLDVHSNHLGSVSLQQADWGTIYMQLRVHNLNCTVR